MKIARSIAFALACAGVALAQERAVLFDAVGKVLLADYCDASFRAQQLPRLLAEFRPQALAAQDARAEREVVQALLEHIPASHLALYSAATSDRLEAEIRGEARPGIGCSLTQSDGGYFLEIGRAHV